MNVFELCAKLKLDDSEYKKGLGESEGLASKAGGAMASAFGAVAKASVTAFAVAGGAVASVAKQAIDSYADFEQLKGGVETLFDNTENIQAFREALIDMGVAGSAVEEQIKAMQSPIDIVMENASKAYKTAGLSANEYMETVTSMASALNQSTGDLEVSAKMADMAITDMSDNANKMGTSMESIQNAYKGFAKANYTMLDNLALGYGGTKEEMQRLLEDAQAISGVEYDISSYADIVDAIHTVQTSIGITGTTAKEASTTISGSLNMVKGAWANLLTGMADDDANFDELIGNLVESVGAFGDNIMPRISIALEGIGEVVQQVAPIIVAQLPPLIESVLPSLLNSVTVLIQGIAQALPSLINMISQMIPTLITTILPVIISSGATILSSLAQAIIDNLPMLLETGLQIILELANSLTEALPSMIPQIVQVILTIVDTLLSNLDTLIDASIAIILALADGLVASMPLLAEYIPEIVLKIVSALISNAPKMLNASIKLVLALADGLVQYWSTLIGRIPQLVSRMVEKFKSLATNWKSIGKDIVEALWGGLSERWNKLVADAKNLASNLWDALKKIFGLGGGSSDSSSSSTSSSSYSISASDNTMPTSSTMTAGMLDAYTNSIASNQNITVVLQGDAGRIFRLVQEQSAKNVKLTGQPSF